MSQTFSANLNLRVLVLFVVSSMLSAASAQEQVSFNQQVRPILTDICFNCHGPDAAATEGGARLDSFEAATGEGDSGDPIVVPGDSANSGLVKRILDADDPMPPADFEKQLTDEQKQILKDWVDQGAKYESHWAFIPPTRPTLPDVKNKAWPRTPIDRFVLAKLESEGLEPTDPASKSTLIRRLALDLTGLPPTVEQVERFLDDDSEDAYERLVDRLLASPNFGERMAIPWLDYARYADSNGFQTDTSRHMWAWRDWVINAYNRNLPFDRFTVEQIAGDMLPNPSRAQRIATGFNRNHRLNGEGGRIVDEWFVETVIDRVETTGMTWLGLTFNCCRCHDHKYDPISQKEFFQMFAFFNSVEESGVLAPKGKNGDNSPPLLELTTPAMEAKIKEFESQIAAADATSKKLIETESELVTQWVNSLKFDATSDKSIWSIAKPKKVSGERGVKFERKSDGSYLAKGKNPAKTVYTIEIPLPKSKSPITAVMLEAIQDDSLPQKLLGRSSNGNFVLTDFTMEVRPAKTKAGAGDDQPESIPVEFQRAQADYEQDGWTAFSVITPKSKIERGKNKGWATNGFESKPGAANRIMFVASQPIDAPADSVAVIKIFHQSRHASHSIGRFRIQTTSEDADKVVLGDVLIPKDITDILAIAPKDRSKKQTTMLNAFYRSSIPNPIKAAEKKVSDLNAELKVYRDRLPTTMVMQEGKKRQAFILERGEYDQKGDKVERGVPNFLPPMAEGQTMDRLGLAKWITDPGNPLTARVWVNRTWALFFGNGIVKTTENFGTQAEFPSHPELLDWMAVEFIEAKHLPDVGGQSAQSWDMKAFIKMLVTSSTYRQSSRVTPDQVERDPENRLLSRGPRFRLTGELIRDQALAVSGLLVNKIGGPSVRPYMPERVWDETSVYGDLRNYKHDTGDGRYRRSLYTIWKRTAAPPSMLLFDAPSREVCTVKRSKTNTPLQALSLLNEITYVEAAQGLAKQMIRSKGESPKQKIAHGFKIITARDATETELNVLLGGFQMDLDNFQKDESAAKAFLQSVDESATSSLKPSEYALHAAYGLTANVLLNLDEFVSRE